MSLSEHQQIRFPTQRPDEQVVLLLRRHWTIIAGYMMKFILLLIFPPIVAGLVIYYTDMVIDTNSMLYVLVVEGLSVYYLFAILSYFHDFVDYHLDIWVVTTHRVVSIEQEGLFTRTVAELNILRVQDVTSEIRGQVQTFLDFGQVYIQTAGEKQRFIFEQIPHPSQVAQAILEAHDRALKMDELQQVREGEVYRHTLDTEMNTQHVPRTPPSAPLT